MINAGKIILTDSKGNRPEIYNTEGEKSTCSSDI